MKGVSARYPKVDPGSARLVNIEGRINQCRMQHQQAPALRYESDELLALTAYVGHQSHGMPVQVAIDSAGRITIDEQPIADAALAAKLAALAAQPQPAEGRRIYLRADRSLDYGRVMRVMGELNRAGLNRVALVSAPGGTPSTSKLGDQP